MEYCEVVLLEKTLVVEQAQVERVKVAVALPVLSDFLPAEALGSGIGKSGRFIADAFDDSVDVADRRLLLGQLYESAPA